MDFQGRYVWDKVGGGGKLKPFCGSWHSLLGIYSGLNSKHTPHQQSYYEIDKNEEYILNYIYISIKDSFAAIKSESCNT